MHLTRSRLAQRAAAQELASHVALRLQRCARPPRFWDRDGLRCRPDNHRNRFRRPKSCSALLRTGTAVEVCSSFSAGRCPAQLNFPMGLGYFEARSSRTDIRHSDAGQPIASANTVRALRPTRFLRDGATPPSGPSDSQRGKECKQQVTRELFLDSNLRLTFKLSRKKDLCGTKHLAEAVFEASRNVLHVPVMPTSHFSTGPTSPPVLSLCLTK